MTDPAAAGATPFQTAVLASLRTLQQKMDLIMGAQDDALAAAAAIEGQNAALAGLVTALAGQLTSLQAGEAAIKAEIATLQGTGAVDPATLARLDAAVAQMSTRPLADAVSALSAEIANVDNIAPAPPPGP